MKKITIIVVVIVLVVIGIYFITQSFSDKADRNQNRDVVVDTNLPADGRSPDVSPIGPNVPKTESVIGKSIEGRDITAYHYGQLNDESATKLLFVGGIHGGYEWNTVLVAYELMDYLKENPTVIPENVKVTVIPALNPDGLNKVVGTTSPTDRFARTDVSSSQAVRVSGRFNARNVDLNRNFDCDWQSIGTWQNKKVDGGSAAFSEPESLSLKNFVEMDKPDAVVAWYSAAGGVFASSCHNGVLPETLAITNVYANASGYKAYEEFNFYEITGDMVNWFAKNNIPAISVLLTTHEDTEWTKNQKGIDALLKHYGKQAQ